MVIISQFFVVGNPQDMAVENFRDMSQCISCCYFETYTLFILQAPGNHEFDDKIAGFQPFVQNITFPIVCANCDFTKYPTLQSLIRPSITIEVGGTKIGIIGVLTPETLVSKKHKNNNSNKVMIRVGIK